MERTALPRLRPSNRKPTSDSLTRLLNLELWNSTQRGDRKSVEAHLALGANPWTEIPVCGTDDKDCPLFFSIRSPPHDILDIYINFYSDGDIVNTAYKGTTPLMYAVQIGNDIAVEMLLDHAAIDVNGVGNHCLERPLQRAIRQKNRRIVHMLLEDGRTDPKLVDCQLGYNVYEAAVLAADLQVLRLLLDKNVDPSLTTGASGSTALTFAILQGKREVAELLVNDKRVDPNAPDKTGRTALMTATLFGAHEMVQLIVNINEDAVLVKDGGDCTALYHIRSLRVRCGRRICNKFQEIRRRWDKADDGTDVWEQDYDKTELIL